MSTREFGMFTAAGNRSLTKKFDALKDKVSRAKSQSEILSAVEKLLKSYRRMCNCKSYPEAADTAVREMVWYELTQVVGQDMARIAWPD